MFGTGKKSGKPLNVGQWLYKIEQESKSKKALNTFGSAEAYKTAKHHEMLQALGATQYAKYFKHIRNFYTLYSSSADTASVSSDLLAPSAQQEAGPSNSQSSAIADDVNRAAGASSGSTPTKRIGTPVKGDTPTKLGKASEPEAAANLPDIPEEVEMAEVAANPLGVGGAAAGAGTAGLGGGIADQALQFYRAQGFSQSGNKCQFQNSFRCRSFGNALFLDMASPTNSQPQITTPMVALPIEHLSFFVPYSTYRWMTNVEGLYVTGIEVKVTPIGQMVSFSTNSPATQSAAPAHTLYGMANIGLNTRVPCEKVTITRNSQSPMELSRADTFNDMTEWNRRLWGVDNTRERNNVHSAINHEIIIPNTYLRINQFSNEAGLFPPPVAYGVSFSCGRFGYYPLNRFLTKFPMKPHTGLPVINYKHQIDPPLATTFREILIGNTTNANDTTPNTQKAMSLPVFRTRAGMGRIQLTASERSQLNTEPIVDRFNYPLNTYALNDTTDYNNYLRVTLGSHIILTINGQQTMTHTIPGVFFGIEAVQSNVPEIGTANYVNASCDWYVETNIKFEFKPEEVPMPYIANRGRALHLLSSPATLERPIRTITNSNNVFNQSVMGLQMYRIPGTRADDDLIPEVSAAQSMSTQEERPPMADQAPSLAQQRQQSVPADLRALFEDEPMQSDQPLQPNKLKLYINKTPRNAE